MQTVATPENTESMSHIAQPAVQKRHADTVVLLI